MSTSLKLLTCLLTYYQDQSGFNLGQSFPLIPLDSTPTSQHAQADTYPVSQAGMISSHTSSNAATTMQVLDIVRGGPLPVEPTWAYDQYQAPAPGHTQPPNLGPAPTSPLQHLHCRPTSEGSGPTSSNVNSHNNTLFSPAPSGDPSCTHSYTGSKGVSRFGPSATDPQSSEPVAGPSSSSIGQSLAAADPCHHGSPWSSEDKEIILLFFLGSTTQPDYLLAAMKTPRVVRQENLAEVPPEWSIVCRRHSLIH